MATTATISRAKARKVPARKTASKKSATKKAAVKKPEPSFAVKAQENAHNVFLAGLGAYGKAFEEAQSQIEDARSQVKETRGKAGDLFNELVKRGEKVQTKARKRIKDLDLPKLKLKLADHDELRARIDKARESFDTLREAIAP